MVGDEVPGGAPGGGADPVEAGVGAQVPLGAVVAAVDGSERDEAVVRWAAAEAGRRGSPLHVLNARESLSNMLLPADPSFAPAMVSADELDRLDGSDALVAEATSRARAAAPGVAVTSSRPWGTAASTLLAVAERASTIVVGAGRRGALARFFLGSTALSVIAHAPCPVVVVGPDGDPAPAHGLLVVGVDGSSDSRAALEYAVDAAERRGADLVVVTAWNVEVEDGYVVTTPGSPEWERVVARHREAVERLVVPLREAHPSVAVGLEIVHGPRVATLVDRSGGADLLVVGSRGRGGFAGMLLGSVSQGVVHEAHCPVAVVTHH